MSLKQCPFFKNRETDAFCYIKKKVSYSTAVSQSVILALDLISVCLAGKTKTGPCQCLS